MEYSKPITEIIPRRISVRNYEKKEIEAKTKEEIKEALSGITQGPLGGKMRFQLVTTTGKNGESRQKLGTYGFIKGATLFIAGALSKEQSAGKSLEEFGYMMEKIILYATDRGLGTCWLGASFHRSRFATVMNLEENELIPAITPLGYASEKKRLVNSYIRWYAKSDSRKPAEQLFFEESFSKPRTAGGTDPVDTVLEMVRMGPSASNRQPWRIIKEKRRNIYHFYLQRTKGYYESLNKMGSADLERIDMGIAMCHFEFSGRELGLTGQWVVQDPGLTTLPDLTEYTASFIGD